MKVLFSVVGVAFLVTGCNQASNHESQALQAKQATIDSMRTVIAKKAVIDSMNAVMAKKEAELQQQIEEDSLQLVANSNTSATQNNAVAAAPAKTKKKWSHTAKGAVVGAGTGAITGAIINKDHRAKGAIIGTVVGAGVGAGTGAIVDAHVKKRNQNN